MAQMVRSSQYRDMQRGQPEWDRWLSAWMPGGAMETTLAEGVFVPPVNISEDKDGYVIQMELPGVHRDDIRVMYENGVLTIQGERKQEKEEKDKQYHRVERVFGMFERSFRLPSTVKADHIQAEFRDGVLTLTVPKAEEAKPRQITINVMGGDGGSNGGRQGGQPSGGAQSSTATSGTTEGSRSTRGSKS